VEVLDLRNERCPMSLITFKRYLLLQDKATGIQAVTQLCLLFSNQQAMQDITLYLDKKNYYYSENIRNDSCSLMIQLDDTTEQ
jgi:TusA-related sulfurtransferase